MKIKPSFIPAILWFIITTILLTLPGSAFPKENWLDKISFDKWVHIGLFSIMVVLWSWAALRFHQSKSRRARTFVSIAISVLAYGIAMEFVQKYWVINRSFDRGDIIADGAGAALGLMFSMKRYIKN